MQVSEERLQKALHYLAATDVPAAQAKALVEGLSEQRKTLKALGFNRSMGNNEERTNSAYASKEYKEHLKKLTQAIEDYEILRNKRLTNSLIVEVWRTEQANRRSGNI